MPGADGGARRDSTSSVTSKAERRSGPMRLAKSVKRSLSSSRTGPGSRQSEPGEAELANPDWEAMSVGSGSSASSRGSRASFTSASKALFSKLVPRRSSSASRLSAVSTSGSKDILPGDRIITLAPVVLRREEGIESEELMNLGTDTALEVVEVRGRRLQVRCSAGEGWVSTKTRLDEPLVQKCVPCAYFDLREPALASKYEIKHTVSVQIDQSLSSEVKAKLKPGTIVTVAELHPVDRYRVRIAAPSITGWISLVSWGGKVMAGEPTELLNDLGPEGVVFMPKYLKIRSLLEAAVSGDSEAVRKLIEPKGGLFGSAGRAPPSVNSVDIRGKTALMYACAMGHKDLTAYLLSRAEVDVNALDDTLKTALHHASKRGRSKRLGEGTFDQSDIVRWLLDRCAQLEARDHNGCTPLMFAVANGDEAVVRMLLVANANVNVKDWEGHTPLDYAINFTHMGIAEVLRGKGAVGELDQPPEEAAVAEEAADEDAADEEAAQPAPDADATAADQPPAAVEKPLRKAKAAPRKSALPKAGASSAALVGAEKAVAKSKAKSKKSAAKAEAASPSPKKGKKKSMAASAGMMEAVSAAAEEAVKVSVLETADAEEADDRKRALAKVKELVKSSPSRCELDAAIKAAVSAGATDADLTEARACLEALGAKDSACEALRRAKAAGDVEGLRAAIAAAETAKVPSKLIAEAKKVLAAEEPKQRARDALEEAHKAGDIPRLKAAVAEARKAGLEAEELAAFVELVDGAESKEKAEALLTAAIEEKDVAGLRCALQQARGAGVDASLIQRAEAVLAEEAPRQEARARLDAACDRPSVDGLEEAIRLADAAQVEAGLIQAAVAQLRQEEEKLVKLAGAKKALEAVAGVDMSSVDALREAKELLSVAIKAATDAGVAEADLAEAEGRRKKLHNTIEDLKGSIRVFCRVRPLSRKENEQNDTDVVKVLDSMSLAVDGTGYSFDAVFSPGTQEEVFEDCRDLVQSAVDGYNVTMFAYGQTGAGKTFTMYGAPKHEGTAPRTINEIFRVIDQGRARFSYTVMGSMLELYRNDLVDLLSKGNPASTKAKLNIRTDKTGSVVVEHLTAEECKSAEELRALLERGNDQRTVAATAMNSESSRSHLVLIVTIVSVNCETKEQHKGKILICDLAGSERLKKSQVSEEMQKEAIEINKSLTALGDVIEALTSGQKIVPYRNHKLTQLMQDALGGFAKTLMFVNCSPAKSNTQETAMSLKYATRAKRITNTSKRGSL